MQVYELKRIVEDNFEEEFQKYIGYLPLKEKFYSKRNYKIGLSILFVLLIVIIILGILVEGVTPISLLINVLIPRNIFMLLFDISIIYHLVAPTIVLDFKKKLQYQFKKISFSSISSLILKSNFKLEITHNGGKSVIYIGNVKNVKRLVLILKKEFEEKLVIQ
mgnify:CR=1 FL=1